MCGGTDIYPISYPPGIHSLLPNKEISMVGDYANLMRDVNGEKPFWMTLQIAWSGVAKPDKTLRMPTFAEERYMTYQAIIDGARGLVYFGGHVPQAWNERDKALQWNWTFWERVLKSVLDEVGEKGPLAEALTAPDGPTRTTAAGIEYTVRSTATATYLIAAKREGDTVQATFTGRPTGSRSVGVVLFESPPVRAAEMDVGRLFKRGENSVDVLAGAVEYFDRAAAAPVGDEQIAIDVEVHPVGSADMVSREPAEQTLVGDRAGAAQRVAEQPLQRCAVIDLRAERRRIRGQPHSPRGICEPGSAGAAGAPRSGKSDRTARVSSCPANRRTSG